MTSDHQIDSKVMRAYKLDGLLVGLARADIQDGSDRGILLIRVGASILS
jgi:hypothetical protein